MNGDGVMKGQVSEHAPQEETLHAYVDGQLPPAQRATVEAWLADDAEAAARVMAYRMQNTALHALFDPVLHETPPTTTHDLGRMLERRLAVVSEQRADRAATPAANNNHYSHFWEPRLLRRLAASLALFLAGALGGYLGHGFGERGLATVVVRPEFLQVFAEEAAQAHSFYTAESRFVVEMGADDKADLDSWLSKRLGRTVFAPDMSGRGYKLIGGRALPASGGAGAQYMYEDAGNARLTLFIGAPPAEQEAAFSFVQQGDVSLIYWIESGLAYALIAPLDRDSLMDLTKVVSQEIKAGNRRPPPAKDS